MEKELEDVCSILEEVMGIEEFFPALMATIQQGSLDEGQKKTQDSLNVDSKRQC